jgi:phage terminase small subunit
MGGLGNNVSVQRGRRLGRNGQKRGPFIVDDFGLTAKQRRFCDHLLADPEEIKVAAYEAAGYNGSKKNQSKAIAKIMMSPPVIAYLMMKREGMRKRQHIKQDNVLKELAHIGFFDPGELFDDKGTLRQINDMPSRARKAIASIDVYTEYAGRGTKRKAVGTTTKIKFVDKKGALDSISRILGFFQNDTGLDASAVGQLMQLVAESRGGSTIGRLDGGHLGSSGPISGSVVATQQPVPHSRQAGPVGPLQAQLGTDGASGELLVHECDPEGETAGDDDVYRHPVAG